MSRLPALWLLLPLALTACSALEPQPIGAPADPDAQMRPDLIVAEPERVAAGDVLELSFPEETSRGIHFVLEQQVRGRWFYMFDLTSDGPGPPFEHAWSPAGAEGFAIPDIGVGGPGPDRVPIPDVASPGTWRICTGNAGSEICTQIEIVDS